MLNIPSCTLQNNSSTSIISSNMDIPSSSSSSSTFVAGGRALDRHNPIITDEKRSSDGISSKPGTPLTNHVLQQKPTTPTTTTTTFSSPNTRKKKTYNKSPLKANKNTNLKPNLAFDEYDNNDEDYISPLESDKMTKTAAFESSKANNVDYVSPPESSRYLLDDTSFLDVLSGGFDDPVMNLDPNKGSESNPVEVSGLDEDMSNLPPKPSSASSDQVVVLRVSLHCRGCERKMKKHLSRMSGVTSFNIDFAAKKVTVIGDVTPLQVLANISKVKTAKLWSPTTIQSSSYVNAKNLEAKQ